MKKFLLLSIGLLLSQLLFAQQNQNAIPLPTAAQKEWQENERIMFVHYGPAAWQNREYDNWSSSINDMTMSKLNTDQWCQVAKSWGAKTIIFVAKHCGGFCWWQTETTDYSIKNTPWEQGKGDVLKDLSESCQKYGLGLGIYIYPGDEHWGAGIGSGGITEDPSKQEAFNAVYRQQLTEVLSRYGTINEVWFDGNCKIEVADLLEKYAPNAVIFQSQSASLRWVGNEDGYAPDPNWYTISQKDLLTGVATSLHSNLYGNCYAPVEIDVPFLKNNGHKWFWAPNTDSLLMSVDQLMNLYYKSVGRGAVLLLNSTPDTSGLIPASHVARYKAFGDEINRRFGKPLANTNGHQRELTITFPKPTTINHTQICENLTYGQRVIAYRTEYSTDGKTWQPLYQGNSIGNKKIDYFPDVTAKAVRLIIDKDKDIPYLSDFALYHVADMHGIAQGNTANPAVQVGYWEADTYNPDEWKPLQIDLTRVINQVGEYELNFHTLSYDYLSGKPSGLEFKDAKLTMYGKECPEALSQSANGYTYRITRSQQIGDNRPVMLTIMVKRKEAPSGGEIIVKKISY